MRGNQVGNEVKTKTPPNGAEDVACDFSHSAHQAKAMVELREELKQEG